MHYLKQSTSVTLQMGPALDKTDGVTAESGLSPTIYLSKNGGAQNPRNSAGAIAHDRDGFYTVPIDDTDTGTLGRLLVQFSDSATHLPVWHEYMVVPANIYDSLVGGTDNLQVDTIQISGDSTAADNLELDYDGTGLTRANSTIGTVTAVTNAVTAGTVSDKTGYALSAAGIQAIWDALTSALTTVGSIGKLLVDNIDAAISSRSSHTAANVRTEMDSNSTQLAAIVADTNELQTDWVDGGRLDLLVDAIKAKTDNLPADPASTTDITGLNDPTAAAIADAVWDEAKAGHVAAGSFGAEVQAHATSGEIAALNDLSAADAADAVWDEAKAGHVGVGSFGEEVQAHALSTEIAALNDPSAATVADAVWDEAIAGHLGVGSTGEALNAAGAAGDPWSVALPGAYGAGTAGNILGTNLDAAISSISAVVFPAGAVEFTYTVINSVTLAPLDGAEVWISTDNPATNIIWKGETDAFGIARDVNNNKPMLDAGTYYFWRQLGGYIFNNPDTEVVS